uniref:Domain of unknown function DB domain-containing protein n=1 Tax=Romanomermis culicivorax TaxID=13658 RepID=A0A915KDS7_ROMCU
MRFYGFSLFFTLFWVMTEQQQPQEKKEIRLPECKILVAGKKKNSCTYCYTKRIKEKCSELCRSNGCFGSTETSSRQETTPSSKKPKTHKSTTILSKESTRRSSEFLTTTGQPRFTTTKSSEESGSVESRTSAPSTANRGSCDGIKPCVPIKPANDRFRQCCIDSKVSKKCWNSCRYNVTRGELQDRVIKGDCPGDHLRKFMTCASTSRSADACCRKMGVYESGRKICEPVCNPASKDWPKNQEEGKRLLPCLSKFNEIFKCHWATKTPDDI